MHTAAILKTGSTALTLCMSCVRCAGLSELELIDLLSLCEDVLVEVMFITRYVWK
jgi:hypothetical protein